jgi:hypothetical protein
MTGSGNTVVFGSLTWNNFHRYMPRDRQQLQGAWSSNAKKDAVAFWYALLMDAVDSYTNKYKVTYPARLYAVPGTIDLNAEWTDDYRTDLVQELFDHLYKQTKNSSIPTGNQFIVIEGEARNINHVRNLLRKHLRRVLAHRLIQTEIGRANQKLFTALKKAPFIDTTPGTKQFRQKLIGIPGWEMSVHHDEEVSLPLAVREFSLMKRNNPQLGVVAVDHEQRRPNWYPTAEYVKASSRVIAQVVGGPVSPDYLTIALEHALRLLDSYRESREKKEDINDKFDENDPEIHQSGSDVRFEGTSKLNEFVEPEIGEEVNVLKTTMLAMLKQRHPTRDIEILYGLSIRTKINDIAEALGISVKTVSRRRDEIYVPYLEWVKEYGEQVVGICLRQIFSEREFTEVAQ